MAPLTPLFVRLGLIVFAGLYAAQSREAVGKNCLMARRMKARGMLEDTLVV
jgi:hypothetical protein